ncbi:hypothetical protein CAPTEDRAFT_215015 [Capitella teleta]|uniref:F-box domain-containing protein n=1 Tax=Capitella teleta TaxID=283909 RepID=R7TEK0_CAPTE|nr:hypothetical protein CAPTEDRAFT_215015 [Capitella teleta]|eukprot:ELT92154.1 hypothetical protein CAPTEDRAFT_215015 [Capitella teleta]
MDAPLSDEESSFLETLPTVIMLQILSYLHWTDKLNLGEAIPSWEEALCSSIAWPHIDYREISLRCQKDRIVLYNCIEQYGAYIQSISISFRSALGIGGSQILKEIRCKCHNLSRLEFATTIWDPCGGVLFCQILSSCRQLKEVSLVKPSLVWGLGKVCKDSVLVPLIKDGHSSKITKLLLSSESLIDHEGTLDILKNFTRLRTLRVRREELSDDVLIHLARHSLANLSIFQDEEMPLSEPMVYTASVWEEVLNLQPAFHVNLVLRHIVLLRSLFPVMVPLRALVLVDLSASLTKGILDTISEHYHYTLEVFVYSKSYLVGSANLEDRRLPLALLDLACRCKKLHTLVYGFEISSTTALLLAHKRKLRHFSILLEELSFEFDWCHQPDWKPEYVEWLRQSGRSILTLEEEISKLLGYKWRVASDQSMFQDVSYFVNI